MIVLLPSSMFCCHWNNAFRNRADTRCLSAPGHIVEDLSAGELGRLLKHRIKLSPGAHGSAWVSTLLAMDEPCDLFVEPTEVRRFIFHGDQDAASVDLITAPVGAALVTFLTTPHLRQLLCHGKQRLVSKVPIFHACSCG